MSNKKITKSFCGHEIVFDGIKQWADKYGISSSAAIEYFVKRICAPEIPELKKFFELQEEMSKLNTSKKRRNKS